MLMSAGRKPLGTCTCMRKMYEKDVEASVLPYLHDCITVRFTLSINCHYNFLGTLSVPGVVCRYAYAPFCLVISILIPSENVNIGGRKQRFYRHGLIYLIL